MGADVLQLTGTTIDGKYRVDRFVGEGGFSAVYRGYHIAFEQPVAIKCLKATAHFDEQARATFLARFLEEGKLLFRLSQHASIVRVFDLGELVLPHGATMPYLVLEWLEGVTVESMIEQRQAQKAGPMTERQALELLRPAVDALALAHRAGIAHRDLKPANLMLCDTLQGQVIKVLDFGIAKAMQEGEHVHQKATSTSSGVRAFSPQYAAPEQYRSKVFGPTGPWTDVHALGLVMVELVADRAAFVGDEFVDFYEACIGDARPTPRSLGVSVSNAFETLCAKCLAKQPTDRLQDADELLAAIDALVLDVHGMMVGSGSTTCTYRPSGTPARPAAEFALTMAGDPAPPACARNAPGKFTQPRAYARAREIARCLRRAALRHASPLAKSHVAWAAGTGAAVLVVAAAVLAWWVPRHRSGTRAVQIGETLAVPGGTFSQGSVQGAPDQRPVHQVRVAPFALDRTEVTVDSYRACVADGACVAQDTVFLIGVPEKDEPAWNTLCNYARDDRARHPINCVDWTQALAFCTWAGKRLPTETEWEYAARGGDEQRTHPWGDEPLSPKRANACGRECAELAKQQGWSWKPLPNWHDPFPDTAPVGQSLAGAGRWGHLDLTGNAWEWTDSYFCPYDVSDAACAKSARVARGGGWSSRYEGIFRSAFRAKYPPTYRAHDVGFRCAQDVPSSH
ncbi:MAG: bifunctional serine/threonine-protein kinase/formylglycine-generating enzyme family protein [Polyangiaceae bacterium]|nr:bifunctional serine/threonine-protein kinase/formylglycine-generating enzyme family protein [Polyangiaceae bacterium]